MKLKALTTIITGMGTFSVGDTFHCPEIEGQDLIDRGAAEAVIPKARVSFGGKVAVPNKSKGTNENGK